MPGSIGDPRFASQLITVDVEIRGDAPALVSEIRQKVEDLSPILVEIGEQVLLPSFARTFMAGGRPAWRFKGFQSDPPMRRTDTLFRAVTERGAPGNVFIVGKNELTVGVEAALPDAKRGGELRPYPLAHQIGRYPYMGFQHIIISAHEEDVNEILRRISDFVVGARVTVNRKWAGRGA